MWHVLCGWRPPNTRDRFDSSCRTSSGGWVFFVASIENDGVARIDTGVGHSVIEKAGIQSNQSGSKIFWRKTLFGQIAPPPKQHWPKSRNTAVQSDWIWYFTLALPQSHNVPMFTAKDWWEAWPWAKTVVFFSLTTGARTCWEEEYCDAKWRLSLESRGNPFALKSSFYVLLFKGSFLLPFFDVYSFNMDLYPSRKAHYALAHRSVSNRSCCLVFVVSRLAWDCYKGATPMLTRTICFLSEHFPFWLFWRRRDLFRPDCSHFWCVSAQIGSVGTTVGRATTNEVRCSFWSSVSTTVFDAWRRGGGWGPRPFTESIHKKHTHKMQKSLDKNCCSAFLGHTSWWSNPGLQPAPLLCRLRL